MSTADLQELRTELGNLVLHESDFTLGDAFLRRLASVKQQIGWADTAAEPWLGEWLSAEHFKGATLWTAAKSNWAKEMSNGADSTFNVHTRARLVELFNAWATDCRAPWGLPAVWANRCRCRGVEGSARAVPARRGSQSSEDLG